jgi:hypothetical protein
VSVHPSLCTYTYLLCVSVRCVLCRQQGHGEG